jgi:CcmD family protein
MDNRNFLYMFYGFAVAWAIVVVYVLILVSRERRLAEEMRRLRSMIESTEDRRS